MNIFHVLDTVLDVGTRDKIQSSLRTCSLVEEIEILSCIRSSVIEVMWEYGGQAQIGENWGDISKQAFIRGNAKGFGDT